MRPGRREHTLRSARVTGALSLAIATGCGARSGLRVPDVTMDGSSRDRIEPLDAFDVRDAGDARDASDAIDVFDVVDTVDVAIDTPPPLCADGGVEFIYVIGRDNQLFSYYPPSGAFSFIGTIRCPVDPSIMPYSMSVDHTGTAYVVFDDGHLFRVSTATARCDATTFVPNQHGFMTFGMGFAANAPDPGETLYVIEANFSGPSLGLATIDVDSLVLSVVGPVRLGRSELSGTGDGRLYAFTVPANPGELNTLTQLDPHTATALSTTALTTGDPNAAFAFAFWGNDFYIFTSTEGPSVVQRYRPSDGSITRVAMAPTTIVGAGVSTCAPH